MQKTSFVTGILGSALGCAAAITLLYFTYTMWDENHKATLAQQRGPMNISYRDLASHQDLNRQVVTLTDAKVAPEFSQNQKKKWSAAFLLLPADPAVNKSAIPVMIQNSKIDSPAKAKAFLAEKKFTGTLHNFMRMNTQHVEQLGELHPQVDLGRGYVLIMPPRKGDVSVQYHAYGIGLLWVIFFLYSFSRLISEIKKARIHGFSFKPVYQNQANANQSGFDSKWVDRIVPSSRNKSQPDFEETQCVVVPKFPPARYIFQILLGVTFLIFALPMALAARQDLLPDGLLPWFYLSFGLTVLFTILYAYFLYRDVKYPSPAIRKPIEPLSLPGRYSRMFARHEAEIGELGFRKIGEFLTNQRSRQVTCEYLSADGLTVARMTKDLFHEAIVFYSLLCDGKVIMTVDMDVPEVWHGLLKLTKGIKGDFKNTFRIHHQIIAPVQQHVAQVLENELQQFVKYTETIEMQAVGQLDMHPIPIPNMRSFEQDFELESVS